MQAATTRRDGTPAWRVTRSHGRLVLGGENNDNDEIGHVGSTDGDGNEEMGAFMAGEIIAGGVVENYQVVLETN